MKTRQPVSDVLNETKQFAELIAETQQSRQALQQAVDSLRANVERLEAELDRCSHG